MKGPNSLPTMSVEIAIAKPFVHDLLIHIKDPIKYGLKRDLAFDRIVLNLFK